MDDSPNEPTLEQVIAAERRYIKAKLTKFELDQVTDSFNDTAVKQGMLRALTGTTQRGWLHANDWLASWSFPHAEGYRDYVARQVAEIDALRDEVAAFEGEQQHETRMRAFYHRIRDQPETKTYKDARRAMHKADHELANEQARAGTIHQRTLGVAREWASYHAKPLLAAGIGLGVALGVTLPTHSHFEHKDRNRPIHFKANPDNHHPAIRAALGTHNIQMYLDDVWNRGVKSGDASHFTAYDWETAVKDDKLTQKDSVMRPWAIEFGRAKDALKTDLNRFDIATRRIATGGSAIDASWKMDEDETGHTYTTEDCTTDTNGNTHCTTTVHYQCDYIDYTWTLNPTALKNGATMTLDGISRFPQAAVPRTEKMLETKLSLSRTMQHLLNGRTKKEVEEYLKVANQWRGSSLLTRYTHMLQNEEDLARSGVATFLVENTDKFPVVHTQRTNCSAASDYPYGWSEHKRAAQVTGAVFENYSKLLGTVGQLDTVIPKIDKHMSIIGARDTPDAKRDGALQNLADLSRKVYNMNYEGSDWKATRGQRIFFEWLLFTGLAAGVGFGAYKALDTYTELGHRSRMRNAGFGRNYRY